MSFEMKVAATTEKEPNAESQFLCRDWHNAIVKVCVVKNAEDTQKVGDILQQIDELFHYEYDEYEVESEGEYFEFIRDLRMQELFNQLKEIEHNFVATGCCDVWNTNKRGRYFDAYWGF
jgi:hypothetical protein